MPDTPFSPITVRAASISEARVLLAFGVRSDAGLANGACPCNQSNYDIYVIYI